MVRDPDPLHEWPIGLSEGRVEEALRSVEAWVQSKDERPINAIGLHYLRSLPLSDFWRAMILARLGRAEGAVKAYGDGIQKMRAGVQLPWWMWSIYYSKALQQEAREVLRSQGIAVPDPEDKL